MKLLGTLTILKGSMMGFGGGSPKPKPKKVDAPLPPAEKLD